MDGSSFGQEADLNSATSNLEAAARAASCYCSATAGLREDARCSSLADLAAWDQKEQEHSECRFGVGKMSFCAGVLAGLDCLFIHSPKLRHLPLEQKQALQSNRSESMSLNHQSKPKKSLFYLYVSLHSSK